MRPNQVLMFLTLFFLSAFLHRAVAQSLDPTTTFNLINAQQNWTIQQQMLQMQAVQQAQLKAQQDALKQQQLAGMTQYFVGACGSLFSRNTSAEKAAGGATDEVEDTAYSVKQAAWKDLDQRGYDYEPEIDQEVARTVGADYSANFSGGCGKFIDKEGKLGSWGYAAIGQIRNNPEAFGANVPEDITKWCPKYPNMNKSQRELYWVWILMSMAAAESTYQGVTCNPAAKAQGVNSIAKGLFQLGDNQCPKARNLFDPYENMECAIDMLGREMTRRDTVMSTTSKGGNPEATNWAVLRIDGRDAGNTRANAKTRGIMEKYKYCH